MTSSLSLASFYPVAHTVLKPLFPQCLWTGHEQSPAIALTFDDGPHPLHTPKLLDTLNKHNILASFFLLGRCVQRSPHIAQAIHQQGHWIGLHGFDHISFPKLSPDQLHQELHSTQISISQACQIPPEAIIDVRPPNGLFTPKSLSLLHHWSYRSVMWSVVPEDWVRPGVTVVIDRILQQVKNGSIIVLHDGACGGEDVVQIVDELIPRLQDQGFQFVTINQLWQQSNFSTI